jgi:hypothetical protein
MAPGNVSRWQPPAYHTASYDMRRCVSTPSYSLITITQNSVDCQRLRSMAANVRMTTSKDVQEWSVMGVMILLLSSGSGPGLTAEASI